MNAVRTLKRLANEYLDSVHLARSSAVFAAVTALIRGGDIAVSRLGRSIAIDTGPKHGIKRVDRLYANDKLWAEQHHFYRGIARLALRAQRSPRPVILIDWTEAGAATCVLTAALPGTGRALVIYSDAHPLRSYTNPRVEAAFLLKLRDVLPEGVRPILVTDAGFRAPWLRTVVGMGWDYVGRIRGRTRVRARGQSEWASYTALYSRARVRRAVDAGTYSVTRYKPYETRLIVYRGRRKWTPIEKALAQRAGTRAIECAKEPWLLATSLRRTAAKKIVRFYAQRMQIEQTFRDTKSDRFGWGMGKARTKRPRRVDIMVLIAALASTVVFAAGKAAELAGHHRAFQANTVRTRRVLALTTLGRLVLLHPKLDPPLLQRKDFQLRCDSRQSGQSVMA